MDTVSNIANQVQNRRILISIIACLVLTLAISTLMQMSTILAMIVSVQIVFFFLVFNRPIWAIGALLVGQLTVSQFIFMISGTPISMRFIWTIFAFLLLISILGKEKKMFHNLKYIWILILQRILISNLIKLYYIAQSHQ